MNAAIVAYLMHSGGKLAAWGIVGYCISELCVAVYTKDIVHGFHALGWISLAVGALSVTYHLKRTSDMLATGVAEIKESLPGKTIPSTDSAIRSAEETVAKAKRDSRP
jgi:hypothetical protein